MKKVVFYSWQSDLPNGTNRTLIEGVLRDVAREIGDDADTDIEPVIDRDTQGVAGAPNIATAIFKKIDSADIFVADVSIIGSAKKRAVPNPNVLIELGYALKALGHERIVLVFNTAFGKVEKLPFDLRMHRTITYVCPESLVDRSLVKKELTKDFKSALLSGFSHAIPRETSPNIVDVIKNNAPSKKIDLRKYLSDLLVRLEKLQPPMFRDGGTVEELLSAIPATEDVAIEFAKLSETVVLMNDSESAMEIFQWFGKILTKYDPPANTSGRTSNADGDFFRFLGHDLFVSFVVPFLREEKFRELGVLLKGGLKVGPTGHSLQERKEGWNGLAHYSPLLSDEGKKRNPGRVSLQADLLKTRHEKEELSTIIPFKDFMQADFFLYLHGKGTSNGEYYLKWYPHSVIYMQDTPIFISEAVDYPKAMQLCYALEIADTDELKRRLTSSQKLPDVRHFAITDRDIQAIGSTGGAQIIHPSGE